MKNIIPDATHHSPDVKAKNHKVKGIVMICIASILIAALTVEYFKEHAKLESILDRINRADTFPDVYNFGNGVGYAIVCLAIAVMMLIWGIYRVAKNAKAGKTFNGVALIVVITIALIPYFHNQYETKSLKEKLITAQHSWAKERYGIEYDNITTKTVQRVKGPDRQFQDQVLHNGKVIATVCPSYPIDMVFCEPGSANELPLFYLTQK